LLVINLEKTKAIASAVLQLDSAAAVRDYLARQENSQDKILSKGDQKTEKNLE
jgi:hypothetical protein